MNEIKQAVDTLKKLQDKSLVLFNSLENRKMTKKEKELYKNARKIFESGDVNEIYKLLDTLKKNGN